MFAQKLHRLAQWLPDRADLPEGLRIGLPIMVGLLFFAFIGNTTAGVNAMVSAWLVGVQGRNLAYPKRLELLSKSATVCCVTAVLSLLSLYHHLVGVALLCAIGLLYGLCSNQRRYIQLLTYNAGFSLICALHLLDSDSSWQMVLLSTAVGSWLAMISAVIAGPWLSVRQGQQLLSKVQIAFGYWSDILHHSVASNVGQRLARREQLDDSIAVLSHWLLEMPDTEEVEQIAKQLRTVLQLIEAMEEIGRVQQMTSDETKFQLQQYLLKFAEHWRTYLADGTELPEVPLIAEYQQILQTVAQQMQRAQDLDKPLDGDWRQLLSLIWPSDHESIMSQWRLALKKGSREWHHGLRILFTLAICQLVVEILQLPQGFWVTLTAFIVLMVAPLGQLQARIWGRLYGTLIGSLVSLGLVWYLGTGFWLLPATCVVVFLAFATYYKARYEIHVFWVTVLMVFAITLLLPSDPLIALYRTIDTLTGALIAFLAMHLFIPSWTRRWIDSYVDNFVTLEHQWLQQLAQGQRNRALRWQAHRALRQLGQEVSYMRLEPNMSQRELADWQSFLWLGLTLHCTLVVVARQQQRGDLSAAAQQLGAWMPLFRQRMHPHWSIIAPMQLDTDQLHQWLMQDIADLYQWLNWQRPFSLAKEPDSRQHPTE
ncbi:FUSC family protein [Shewanella avicenniae]|uniref:FUSC family protein n=1 Tax=Shewanella avicenniae TaxID=2814294 RepID=A0ABX7QR10_9GAMM|nr:FUSC family protein [Shewanella avicenniae]QSX33901.1 FUSC family protein [Shewanella avicenniae]